MRSRVTFVIFNSSQQTRGLCQTKAAAAIGSQSRKIRKQEEPVLRYYADIKNRQNGNLFPVARLARLHNVGSAS
jgi:hypothetical protein